MTVQRIASLLASSTEILCALGQGSQIVAISHECDCLAEVIDRPRVTSSLVAVEASSQAIDEQVKQLSRESGAIYQVAVDRLAELAPDLIVTQSQCDVCAVSYVDVLSAVENTPELSGAQVVALTPNTLGDIFEDILRVGQATGRTEAAIGLVAGLKDRVEVVRQRVSHVQSRPRVACIEWIEPLMVGANWMPELVELAGGQPGLATGGQKTVYTAWEALRQYDPEVIVVMPCGFDLERTLQEAPTLSQLPGWADLGARRADRVYAVDGNAYFNRSGPRIVDSLEILAYLLHPDAAERPGGEQAWAPLSWVRGASFPLHPGMRLDGRVQRS